MAVALRPPSRGIVPPVVRPIPAANRFSIRRQGELGPRRLAPPLQLCSVLPAKPPDAEVPGVAPVAAARPSNRIPLIRKHGCDPRRPTRRQSIRIYVYCLLTGKKRLRNRSGVYGLQRLHRDSSQVSHYSGSASADVPVAIALLFFWPGGAEGIPTESPTVQSDRRGFPPCV